jgi:ribosomal protein S18 acetylase RimI-like enzyme
MPPSISLKKIDHTSQALVQTLLDAAPTYYLLIDGVPNAGSAKAVFEELPPGRTHADKHVLLIEEDGVPAGVIDLVIGYPKDNIAYIGLLVVDESHQGRGLGRASFQILENYIRNFDVDSIQLGVNDTNHPGMSFWTKLGFQKNGRSRPHQGKQVASTVFVMEKPLG